MTQAEARMKTVLAIAERMFIQHGGKIRAKRSVELALQFVEEAENFTDYMVAQIKAAEIEAENTVVSKTSTVEEAEPTPEVEAVAV